MLALKRGHIRSNKLSTLFWDEFSPESSCFLPNSSTNSVQNRVVFYQIALHPGAKINFEPKAFSAFEMEPLAGRQKPRDKISKILKKLLEDFVACDMMKCLPFV